MNVRQQKPEPPLPRLISIQPLTVEEYVVLMENNALMFYFLDRSLGRNSKHFSSVKSLVGSLINELAWSLNYCSFRHCEEKSMMSSIQSERRGCSARRRADTLHRPQITTHLQKPSSCSTHLFPIRWFTYGSFRLPVTAVAARVKVAWMHILQWQAAASTLWAGETQKDLILSYLIISDCDVLDFSLFIW